VEQATRPFELIHLDLCSPISSPSWSGLGSRYLILNIDVFTHWPYGYFLRTKESTEITTIFQELQAKFETAYPKCPVARFLCDNARGEYDNSLFRGVLRMRGIAFESAPSYTQLKNGVSERMIRTIIGKTRPLMLGSHILDAMWAEATETALYLHSLSHTHSLGNPAPYEMLYGMKPYISHLRRFGCLASQLIPKVHLEGKFSPRS
jgi:hypothetical protein